MAHDAAMGIGYEPGLFDVLHHETGPHQRPGFVQTGFDPLRLAGLRQLPLDLAKDSRSLPTLLVRSLGQLSCALQVVCLGARQHPTVDDNAVGILAPSRDGARCQRQHAGLSLHRPSHCGHLPSTRPPR